MISQFRECHLLSSPFTSKSLAFVNQKLLSPSGTRLNVYQLDKNSVATHQQSTKFNIRLMACSTDGATIIMVDEEENMYIQHHNSLEHMKSKFRVASIKFSSDGRLVAVARGNQLVIYAVGTRLQQLKKYQNKHQSNVKGLAWSPDSRFVLTWGEDNSVILNAVFKLRLYQDVVFQNHKFPIVNAFFLSNHLICTLDQLGKLALWRWVSDFVSEGYLEHQLLQKSRKSRNISNAPQQTGEYEIEELEHMSEFEKNIHRGRFVLAFRMNFKDSNPKFGKIKSAECLGRLLLVGLRNGTIHLYRFEEVPILDSDKKIESEFLTLLQTFQVAEAPISAISFNHDGSWVALGLRLTGQLIVWEWRSQSYILNQSQLSYEVTSSAMNDSLIATGSVSGVVRLWSTTSNLCIAKFSAENEVTDMQSHSSKVTAMLFDNRKRVLMTCSLDGTVRAFDTERLKCFRVMKPEVPNQLMCLAYEGELVCAGGFDPYEIYCFHLQRGHLVEVIAGHKAPVTALSTSPLEETVLLISASWDRTVRVHDLYTRASRTGAGGDSFEHNSDITALAVRNDGAQLSTSTLKGELLIWDIREGQILGTIDVDRDIQGGRASSELFSAQNNTNKKHFCTMAYSQDGQYLLGGGNSKYLCMYDMRFRVLIKKFLITNNHSLEGMNLQVDYRKEHHPYSDDEERKDENLPGAKTFDVTKRNTKKVPVQVHKVEFSSSNQQFVVAHNEGVSVFGTSSTSVEVEECVIIQQIFDPFLVDETVDPQSIQAYLDAGNHVDALINALKLNQQSLCLQVLGTIVDIDKVVRGVPEQLVPRLLSLVVVSDRQVERNLQLVRCVLISKRRTPAIMNALKEVQRHLRTQFQKMEDAIQHCIQAIEFVVVQQSIPSMEVE